MSTSTVQPPSYLSIDGTSQELGCSPDTVRRLIARGELKAYRVGRLIRIRREDLNRALKPVTRVSELTSGGGSVA